MTGSPADSDVRRLRDTSSPWALPGSSPGNDAKVRTRVYVRRVHACIMHARTKSQSYHIDRSAPQSGFYFATYTHPKFGRERRDPLVVHQGSIRSVHFALVWGIGQPHLGYTALA